LVGESWNSEAVVILYVEEVCRGAVSTDFQPLCGRTASRWMDGKPAADALLIIFEIGISFTSTYSAAPS